MRRLIVLVSLLAIVATACKIETNFEGVINADGSGTVIAEIGLDDEAAGFFLQDGSDPFEDSPFADEAGARTREETRGDLTYYIVEVDVNSVEEIEQMLLETDDPLLTNFDITVTDTLVSVTGSASAEELLGEDTGQFDPQLLEDSFSATVRLTLPGEITNHNADRQEGNTLIWDVPLFGGDLDIDAQSDPTGDGGGFPVWLVVVIVAAVLVGGWWYMSIRRRSEPAQPVAEAGATPTAPGSGAAPGDEPPPPPPAG